MKTHAPLKDIRTCEYCDNEFNMDEMYNVGEDSLWFCDGCFQMINPKKK